MVPVGYPGRNAAVVWTLDAGLGSRGRPAWVTATRGRLTGRLSIAYSASVLAIAFVADTGELV